MKSSIAPTIMCLFTLLGLSACGLETINGHQEQEDKKVLQRQVYSLQTVNAEAKQRFEEVDEDIRKLNNRVDVLENKHDQTLSKQEKNASAREGKIKDLEDRLKNYHDEISKLDGQVMSLNQTVAAMGEAQKQMAALAVENAKADKSLSDGSGGSSSGSGASSGGSKSLYEEANALFEKKKWKEAALEFEHYRKASPKGKNVAEATYRMGVCFQEMDSAEDAKAFYQEVLERFPKSASAQRAAYRLKALNKKK